MYSKIITTQSLKETQNVAFDFAKTIKSGDILCFYGQLGSGKTSFIQGLAKGLGIARRIISPTFIIARHYDFNDLNFYHIDLYRTKTREDLLGIGIDEILSDDKNIVAIEWAEKLLDLLPLKRIDLRFEYVDDNTRKITMESHE
ncbi:MAG: tRNA (adenosine(37)-N6)-threonylcarbamoyltransferase complex ATPase subunit type 1 TsaE [Candidatus Levybacteria bacterium]|nr:tRNA (adenosine(37)-N6)-threonylcarbamoyltransferase complex ATPase subunit type 1 TsaE [Candidatus Levybacteria bacterium]